MSGKGSSKYPVDVCYMVADLKYNIRQGVKICEIQQSSLSMFSGDTYRDLPEEQSIHQELLRALASYNKSGWVMYDGMADKKMVATLGGSANWRVPKDLITLFSDTEFKAKAKQAATDVHDISTYTGFLYSSWSEFSTIYDFEDRLPGMVVLDKSSFPFWIDKQLMTELFKEDVLLSSLKPKWGSYKKEFNKGLADKIAKDLDCETFVIKPRGNFLGAGVIIVQKNDLDEVLQLIIAKKGNLASSKDAAYRAWQKDRFDSFIVEEFVMSDPIKVPALDNRTYQPTMRVAFLLVYNKCEYEVKFLGGYWKTPAVSLDEEGDFMAKNKDICKPPYYLGVDKEIMKTVQEQLRPGLIILHQKMLQSSPVSSEELSDRAKRGRPQIKLEQIN